ncbi:MAG: hypothetical protein ACRBEQ_00595 [Hyphomonas sp.]
MTIRQLIGFVLGGFGVWLMWQAGMGMQEYIQNANGAKSIQEALLVPKYALRVLASLAAFVGGLAALTEKMGGAWLAGISSFIFGMTIFGLIANRADVAAWRSEATILVILTGLFLALVVTRNQELAMNTPDEDEDEALA